MKKLLVLISRGKVNKETTLLCNNLELCLNSIKSFSNLLKSRVQQIKELPSKETYPNFIEALCSVNDCSNYVWLTKYYYALPP
eukprot:Pgem_evm1s933